MELHLALRNIVKTDGPSIITEGRLVNILCDFQAFDAIPASKYVMRAIIDDGYSKKLLQCTKWDMAAQQLSDQFASSTGFQPDIVWTIFQSLAFGLGWINSLEAPSSAPSNNLPINPKSRNAGNHPVSVDDLVKLIEIKTEGFTSRGFNISNISFEESGNYILMYAELDGKKRKEMPEVHVAIYCSSKIIAHEYVCYESFAVATWYFDSIKKRLSDITRILIYVTD